MALTTGRFWDNTSTCSPLLGGLGCNSEGGSPTLKASSKIALTILWRWTMRLPSNASDTTTTLKWLSVPGGDPWSPLSSITSQQTGLKVSNNLSSIILRSVVGPCGDVVAPKGALTAGGFAEMVSVPHARGATCHTGRAWGAA
eukprot:CAMPEP_0174357726 /NCGR_PEP_ID=MMETSP0811_2-20130205/37616_1 /TAXON_ID=73025 ORGANISM="Eutreptiella gymnastica-like, Strain CCMP1594" /NCGR_SAMPLE_ID=MMETSP0811_2 /ASSEMBLY_ACC=CAM_ASM_000667 /LENGTH=142 /DNA_ID=CAMNT_0015490803 /DNA_START=279 /DNA_END=708 /DNA_ORIENTATION=+